MAGPEDPPSGTLPSSDPVDEHDHVAFWHGQLGHRDARQRDRSPWCTSSRGCGRPGDVGTIDPDGMRKGSAMMSGSAARRAGQASRPVVPEIHRPPRGGPVVLGFVAVLDEVVGAVVGHARLLGQRRVARPRRVTRGAPVCSVPEAVCRNTVRTPRSTLRTPCRPSARRHPAKEPGERLPSVSSFGRTDICCSSGAASGYVTLVWTQGLSGRAMKEDGSTGERQRETMEEVGFDPEVGVYLGALDELESPPAVQRRRLVITPHVWLLPGRPDLQPNEEVASVHWFGLPRLLAGEGRGTFSYEWRGRAVELPVVRLDGTDIWGITLRVVDDLLARLQV